ncbi:uncharacterized protein FRV6_11636 [Fusarium oxysporum]|uniref:Uncharacterized protein n=1 Tax=Fusarium oxysporum TaxID=5507 RepID=A0A2H3TZZ1_FUSOX|nr:uncharacterized protein FRV6_11636 [Fusarium oxysporum]
MAFGSSRRVSTILTLQKPENES